MLVATVSNLWHVKQCPRVRSDEVSCLDIKVVWIYLWNYYHHEHIFVKTRSSRYCRYRAWFEDIRHHTSSNKPCPSRYVTLHRLTHQTIVFKFTFELLKHPHHVHSPQNMTLYAPQLTHQTIYSSSYVIDTLASPQDIHVRGGVGSRWRCTTNA